MDCSFYSSDFLRQIFRVHLLCLHLPHSRPDKPYPQAGIRYICLLSPILNNFIHSSSPCAFAIFTSRSGFILCIAFTTAFATPPLTAKPLPSALEKESGSSSGSSAAKSTSLAANIPATSSKVSTKSMSLLILLRLASSFLAAPRADKYYSATRVILFCKSACKYHRGESH